MAYYLRNGIKRYIVKQTEKTACDTCLSQLVEHTTLDLGVMSSSPLLGVEIT